MRARHLKPPAKPTGRLLMTPMIDIVFLLLVFFVMTFKILTPEGEFNLKMPRHKPTQVVQPLPPRTTITVHLRAGHDGKLAGIELGERPVQSIDELHLHMREIVGDVHGPGQAAEQLEVELNCDYDLKFEHVINAVTAVSGYVDDGRIVKLVDKISFAPRTSL